MSRIKFGTDGWRGVIARDFTFANVELVARAVAGYLKAHDLAGRGAVVGYDNRFLSDKFAETVAGVLDAEDVPVYIVEKSMPTPVVAFAIKEYAAGGAVMLTASHNPPEYNGIKFIPEYAGPALPHITQEIEENIKKLGGQAKEAKEAAAEISGRRWRRIDPRPAYFAHLKKLVDFAEVGRAGLKVVVDPMYGAGAGFLEELLRGAGVQVEVIHDRRDPLFGGTLPDPAAQSLGELRTRVLASGADLGLALDGDADRFGIIDRDGSYISPNHYLPVVYDHLLNARGWRGPAARTVATTHLLDRIAAGAGQQVYETPVGFKYIGQHLMEKGCLLGGEESGGLSIRGHVPEKDGVLAGLLAAEIVARHRQGLGGRLAEIWGRCGRLYSERVDVHTSREEKERVLGVLRELAPAEVAGKKVTGRLTVDGTKLVLEDGSWLLIRASGTEPLFRIYAEANNPEDLKDIQRWGRSLIR
ncbi:MAG: phosphoglucomutase/phosphomannomutase family protein [Bacillota bacterium]